MSWMVVVVSWFHAWFSVFNGSLCQCSMKHSSAWLSIWRPVERRFYLSFYPHLSSLIRNSAPQAKDQRPLRCLPSLRTLALRPPKPCVFDWAAHINTEWDFNPRLKNYPIGWSLFLFLCFMIVIRNSKFASQCKKCIKPILGLFIGLVIMQYELVFSCFRKSPFTHW